MKKERSNMLKDVAKRHRSRLQAEAKKNTVRNEDGLTVIQKDDPWREDDAETDRTKITRPVEHGVLV